MREGEAVASAANVERVPREEEIESAGTKIVLPRIALVRRDRPEEKASMLLLSVEKGPRRVACEMFEAPHASSATRALDAEDFFVAFSNVHVLHVVCG